MRQRCSIASARGFCDEFSPLHGRQRRAEPNQQASSQVNLRAYIAGVGKPAEAVDIKHRYLTVARAPIHASAHAPTSSAAPTANGAPAPSASKIAPDVAGPMTRPSAPAD